MAQKRMYSMDIVGSDAFLDMPASARLLYYDLGMRADDDGFINNAKSIMRTTGASDDDIKLLVAKKFIIPFESGIVVVKHWNINNYIQKDRYHETKYKDEKALLELDENKAYRLPQYVENSTNIECIQIVSKMDTENRLGKVRLDKVRQGKNTVPYETIVERFNTICQSLSKVVSLTDKRKDKIRKRWEELKTVEAFENLFYITEESDFLCGRGKEWKCSFDWLMLNDTNYVKVLEGNYANKKPQEDPFMKIMREEMQNEQNRINGSNENNQSQLPQLL